MIQISNVHMTHILAVCATSPVGTCTLASNQSAVKILTTLFWTQPLAILTHMLVNKFDMPIFQHTIIWLPKILKSNQSDSFSLASFYCSCTAVLHFIFLRLTSRTCRDSHSCVLHVWQYRHSFALHTVGRRRPATNRPGSRPKHSMETRRRLYKN